MIYHLKCYTCNIVISKDVTAPLTGVVKSSGDEEL